MNWLIIVIRNIFLLYWLPYSLDFFGGSYVAQLLYKYNKFYWNDESFNLFNGYYLVIVDKSIYLYIYLHSK